MKGYVHEFAWSAAAPIDKAFDTLTKADALREWFAQHVEAEAIVGGAFAFWGRHTLETQSRAQATQTITRLDPPHAFGFSWSLLGVDSEVSFTLAEDGEDNKGGTRISGRHAFAALPDVVRAQELIDDLWRLHGGNLSAYLSGAALVLPDFDDPSPEIRQSVLIDAPRSEVFKALITPELLAEWMWADAAVVEAKKGGQYSYGWSYEIEGKQVTGGPTRILDYVENEKLVTDWPDWRGDDSVPHQTISWLLRDEAGKTRLTVVHSGFVRAIDFSDYPFGWANFLTQLRALMEKE